MNIARYDRAPPLPCSRVRSTLIARPTPTPPARDSSRWRWRSSTQPGWSRWSSHCLRSQRLDRTLPKNSARLLAAEILAKAGRGALEGRAGRPCRSGSRKGATCERVIVKIAAFAFIAVAPSGRRVTRFAGEWRFVLPKPDDPFEHPPLRALALSRTKPDDVKEMVRYRGARQRYAQLRYGSPGSIRITVVLDEVSSGRRRSLRRRRPQSAHRGQGPGRRQGPNVEIADGRRGGRRRDDEADSARRDLPARAPPD